MVVSRARLLEFYDDVYSGGDEIPEDVVEKTAPEVLSRIRSGNESLFRELSDSLPETYAVLCEEYDDAMVGRKRIMDKNIVGIVLPGDDWFFHGSVNHSSAFSPDKHDEYYGMLPKEIRAYYFVAESWQLVEQNRIPFVWVGLPRSKYTRPTITDHLRKTGRAKGRTPRIAEKKKVFVWMISAKDELLLVDEQTQKLYAWTVGSNEEAVEIDNPVKYWDSHCAKVFKSGDTSISIF